MVHANEVILDEKLPHLSYMVIVLAAGNHMTSYYSAMLI